MMKRNKWKLLISSIIIVLPMIVALFGEYLPEEIAVHWGPDGVADGFMGAGFFFLIMPPVLLAVHWLCMFLEAVIDKKTAQNIYKNWESKASELYSAIYETLVD